MDQPDIELHGETGRIHDRDLVAAGPGAQRAARHQAKSQSGRDHAELDLGAGGVDRDTQTVVAFSHGAFQPGAIAAAGRVQDPGLLDQASQSNRPTYERATAVLYYRHIDDGANSPRDRRRP